jgi:hypothetical protein
MSLRTLAAAPIGALWGLALAGAIAAPTLAAEKPFDFTGTWMTTEGITPFTQSGAELKGTYPLNKGRFFATVTGDTAEGYWAQSDSVHRCTEAKDGSHYWGRVKFTADPGGQSFSGRRNYCERDVGTAGGDQFVGKRR